MAKQIGEYRFVGTTEDGLCFYKMEGEYYVRMKSRLTGKMFWTRKCFAGSRRSCARLVKGSQLAAVVYARFEKQQDMYKLLKSRGIALLKKEVAEEEVLQLLLVYARELQPRIRRTISRTKVKRKSSFNKIGSLVIPLPIPGRVYNFRRFLSTG